MAPRCFRAAARMAQVSNNTATMTAAVAMRESHGQMKDQTKQHRHRRDRQDRENGAGQFSG